MQYNNPNLSHKNLSCKDYKWILENDDDNKWIERFTKKYPNINCNIRVEKIKGCSHITCSQCNVDFCWDCQDPLENHSKIIYCNKKDDLNEDEQDNSLF